MSAHSDTHVCALSSVPHRNCAISSSPARSERPRPRAFPTMRGRGLLRGLLRRREA